MRAADRRQLATAKVGWVGATAAVGACWGRRMRVTPTAIAHGPLTAGELGALLSLTSGSVTALVGRLEELGWAQREPHPGDRRKVIVSLTRAAWQLGQDELSPYFDAVDGATEDLTPKERAVVRRYLEALVDRISDAPTAG